MQFAKSVFMCSYNAQDKKAIIYPYYSINHLVFVQKDTLDYTGKSSGKGLHYGFFILF
jgi:hypothetical protein